MHKKKFWPVGAEITPQKSVPVSSKIDDKKWSISYQWWDSEWTDWERIMPRGGFVEDFVLSTKGTETATSFAIWGALSMMSSAMNRDSYLALYPAYWYPNMYIIIVSPPGLNKKSIPINEANSILRDYHNYIVDEDARWKKNLNIHTNRVTPEGIQDLLRPTPPVKSKKESSGDIWLDHGSALSLYVGELATFLGRQTYNIGMVGKLTDLYDTKERDQDYTKKDGRQELRKIYVNFFAATTPGDLESVIPEEAFGGGLMSRTIVVYEELKHRNHPLPVHLIGAPTTEELKEKLAWCAVNSIGDYRFTQEAQEYYFEWYEKFSSNLRYEDSLRLLSKSRMDVLLVKTAILIRAQRYEPGREVTREDFTDANRLLNKTYNMNEKAVSTIGSTQQGKSYERIKKFIERRGDITRKDVLTSNSRYVNSEQVSIIVAQLAEVNQIKIMSPEGREIRTPTRNSKERYIWIDGERDG